MRNDNGTHRDENACQLDFFFYFAFCIWHHVLFHFCKNKKKLQVFLNDICQKTKREKNVNFFFYFARTHFKRNSYFTQVSGTNSKIY